ncbi:MULTISPECIES: serine/threonine protein kinase [Nonomuraea]|uniref:non-specific serine/threonine protein kinase n=1 Tax=Nonomuraea mangrovi TaxID=2316207 RepID=A0ABW4TAS9_9ACTN
MHLNERSLIGQEVAGYYIEDVIGKGGMAVVYLALDPRLSRKVALKILNPILSVDDRFRQRFILESRTVASIEHPNIIPIYEANSDEQGVLYISMRYVDGLDLRRFIYDRGPIAVGQVNSIAAQVAAALDAAHAHDLIHRDVKPANILLAGDHVYLTDFGITKHRTSISGLTQTDQFIGTPRYMSPEQINKEHIDGRADQYALACVVYEALAGRMPFERDNDVALLWAHLAESPTPLSHLRPELPLEVDGVMMKALAKSPDQRYPTCTAFVGALRDAISGEIAPTRPQQPVQPKTKPKAKPKTRAKAQTTTARPATAKPRMSGRLPLILTGVVAAIAAIALVVALMLSNRGDGMLVYKPTPAVPMTFDYPDSWTALTHVDLFAIASPSAPQFESLFLAGSAADWSEVNNLEPGDATGLYVQLADTLDPKADLQSMQETLSTMLPGKITFTTDPSRALIAGREGTMFVGIMHGSGNSGELNVTGYLVDTPTRPALVLYFCASSACDPSLLSKIRTSVALT